MSLATQLENEHHARTLPGLAERLPADEFIMPSYDGLGIANLPATIAQLLGRTLSEGTCPPLQESIWTQWQDVQRVVLIVIDALGYLQLQEAMNTNAGRGGIWQRLTQAGTLVPLTSTFPSTTCTVLNTLWTGYSPAAHGSLAFEVFLREFGVAASILFFWPSAHRQRDALRSWGVDPDTFNPVPGLGQQLSEQDVISHALINKSYAHSMLTRILQRGVTHNDGFIGQGDMWLSLARAVAKHTGKGKALITLYCGSVDGITHEYSPDDLAWQLELNNLGHMMQIGFIDQLTPEQRKGTLLLITADHGGVTTLPRHAIKLKAHRQLIDMLRMPPLGESRAPFLYTRGNTYEAAKTYMNEWLSRSFITLTRDEVLDSGLIGPGPVYAETPHRLGDLVGIARGSRYLAQHGRHLEMTGRHGGLSPREMLVPLLGVRLEDIGH